MKVAFFVTCLIDQFWPSIGHSAVKVLRRAGCEVVFDDRQTCCGQPAFNSGYRKDAQTLAKHFISVFEDNDADAIVCPSGSCTAMVHHFHELFSEDDEWRARAERLADRTFEFSSFLVNKLGAGELGAGYKGRVTWHDACHGLRDLCVRNEPRLLINGVKGAELVEMPNAEACCGFGGTFSVKFPEISVAILDSKVDEIIKADVRAVVSGDASCLMQIGGRLSRKSANVETIHIAELLSKNEQ